MSSAKTKKPVAKKKVAKKAVKKVTKKPVAKKKVLKKVVKNKVEMLSYSIKMTIPTGQYANVIPEIVVKAGTPEEAHKYIAPHMNKLWKEYFMISTRAPEIVKPVVPPAPAPTVEPVVVPVVPKEETTVAIEEVEPAEVPASVPPVAADGKKYNQTGYKAPAVEASPVAEAAMVKATQAIQSCLSTEALDLIIRQVGVSTKLTDENKQSLLAVIEEKSVELNNGK